MKDHASPVRVTWPPPGLESSQGVLWQQAGRLAFGGTILVAPLLLSVALPQPYDSLGLFKGGWWLTGLTSLLGLLVVLRALAGIVGFFWEARTAALHGIDMETVLQVGADDKGDMGALLQGSRCYRSLGAERRIRMVRSRVLAALLFLAAAMWIPAGWVLSLLLAGRDYLGPMGVWILTLAPAGLTALTGMVVKGVEGSAAQPVFGSFFWNRWRNPDQSEAARLWGEGMRQVAPEKGSPTPSERRVFLFGALGATGLAAFILVSMASFTFATSAGPVLATMALPRFSTLERKAGEAEALRHLRLSVDPEISPLQAGEALHSLASAGEESRFPGILKSPTRAFETRFGTGFLENPVGIVPPRWATELFPVLRKGVSAEAETFLREAANHPALSEFEVLSRAEGVDVWGGRLSLPIPEGTSALEIPIPRLTPVREGAYAMVARAGIQLLDGNADGAEGTLRTLLSAGFLLAEDSPTLIDALIGFGMVATAGDALESLYEVTERPQAAERLREIRTTAQRAAELAHRRAIGGDVHYTLQSMSSQVIGEELLRGFRWEYFHILAGLSPCINPNQVLFGPNDASLEFLHSARARLVQYPSDEAVFDVMTRGWFNLSTGRGLGRVLSRTAKTVLGTRPGSCAEVLASGLF